MNRWLVPYFLALVSLLAVGWPLRVRMDAPRLGRPHGTDAPRKLEATTSLPFLLPAELRAAWLKQPGARLSWRLNRATLHLPSTPAKKSSSFRLVFAADLAPPHHEALLSQFVEEMEALRPDAVLLGGDLTYQETEAWYSSVSSYLRRLDAQGIPVVIAPGNHERKDWPLYARHFGFVENHRVDLGPLAILTLDSGHGRDRLTPSQMAWLRRELDGLEGRTAVIQMHHPIFPAGAAIHGEAGGSGGSLKGFQKSLVALCESKGVAAILAGHWHSDAVFDATGALRDDRPDFEGPKFIVTTALGNELRRVTRWPHTYYGYRVLDFEGGRLVRYTHDLDGNGKPDPIASKPLGLPKGLKEFPR